MLSQEFAATLNCFSVRSRTSLNEMVVLLSPFAVLKCTDSSKSHVSLSELLVGCTSPPDITLATKYTLASMVNAHKSFLFSRFDFSDETRQTTYNPDL